VVVSVIERLTPAGPLVKPRELEQSVHKGTGREQDDRRETDGALADLDRREPALAGYSAVGLSKRGFDGVREAAMAELAASLPAPHSFGRRGR
jgi:hypothetical protein